MSTDVQSCYIYTENNSQSPIYLLDNIPVIVGRNVDTQITDLKCSRKQVRLCANYEAKRVTIQQIGSRACGFNGAKTLRGEKYLARHGDSLEIIYGKYCYKFEFNPPPSRDENNQEPQSINNQQKKRNCIDSDSEDESPVRGKPVKKSKMDKSSSSEFNLAEETSTSRENAEKSSISEAGESNNFFRKLMDSRKSSGTWQEIDKQALMIFSATGVEGREKIAAFDMDNTLITTQSGHVFPKDHNDWKILYPEVPGKLKKLFDSGYKIVIFTNQGGLGLGKSKPSDFKQKIEKVTTKLGIPMQVFISTARDKYRKPMTGMWEHLVNHVNDSVRVDRHESFFVGDAAGRPKDWMPKAKKDHSLADRLFALNVDLKFQTPEEYFLGYRPVEFTPPAFNPKNLDANKAVFDPPTTKITPKNPEVIVMVGCPASGKSHVVLTHLKNYQHINRDKLGSWQKCVSATEKALREGNGVVIDNTNPDVASRKRFIDVAKARAVPARCFMMTTTLEHAKHNNKFRELTDSNHMVVTDVVIHSYLKNYVAPTKDEGFTEIVNVHFVPNFKSNQERRLYEMYLLEK